MDVMEAVRQLGVSIQADERYKKFMELSDIAKGNEDVTKATEELQATAEKFEAEMAKEDKDEQLLTDIQAEYTAKYRNLFNMSPMKEMMDAREELDAMMNDIMQIIYLTMNGNDPLTAEPSPETLQEMQTNFMNM